MSLLRRALYYSFAGKYINLVIDFISVMVVSRLLTPDDLGVYSLAAGSVVIGQMLRDFGLQLYIVQEKELTLEKIQSCFTISVILCWSIGFIYLLLSEFIGNYLESEEVKLLIMILSINFFVIPFGTFTLALFKRNMMFDKLVFIGVISTVVRVVFLLALLFLGVGVVAIAYASVVGTITTMLMTLPAKNWNHHRFNFSHWKKIIGFSSFVSGGNIIVQLKTIVPEFLIGKYMSMSEVAFFSKANATSSLFNTIVTSALSGVIQPHIAKVNRETGIIASEYYRALNYTIVMQWPFSLFLFFYSEDIVYLLYGDQWGPTSSLVQYLAMVMFLGGLIVFNEQFYYALGKVKFVMYINFIELILKSATVFMFFDKGLDFILKIFVYIVLFKVIVILPKIMSNFSLVFKDWIKVIILNMKLYIGLLLCLLGLELLKEIIEYNAFHAVFVGLIYCCLWLAGLFAIGHPLKNEVLNIFTKISGKF